MNRLVAVAIVLAAFGAAAADTTPCGDPAACLRAVEAAQREVRSLSARFVQTKSLALLEEPLRSTGVFAFQRPDRVLWRVEDPPLEVRVEGTKVRMPASEQAALRSMPPGLESLLGGVSAMFTGDMAAASKRFDIDAEGSAEGVVVRMVPKQSGDRRLIKSIRLTFAPPALELRRIELAESVGDHLEIVFSDIRRNDSSAAALFDER